VVEIQEIDLQKEKHTRSSRITNFTSYTPREFSQEDPLNEYNAVIGELPRGLLKLSFDLCFLFAALVKRMCYGIMFIF